MAQITKCKSNTYSFKATEPRRYHVSDQTKTKDWRNYGFSVLMRDPKDVFYPQEIKSRNFTL